MRFVRGNPVVSVKIIEDAPSSLLPEFPTLVLPLNDCRTLLGIPHAGERCNRKEGRIYKMPRLVFSMELFSLGLEDR